MSLAGGRPFDMPEAMLPRDRLSIHQVPLIQCDFRTSIECLGLAVDSYAVWLDLALGAGLLRAGPRLFYFHVSDRLRDTDNLRFDCGMPDDDMIDNWRLRQWIDDAGFRGSVEIEIFSEQN